MLRHPLLRALFDEQSSDASKQLQLARRLVFQCTERPSIVLILPPAELLLQQIPLDALLFDDFLLAHVAVVHSSGDLLSLDLAVSRLRVRDGELVPLGVGRTPASIVRSYLWQPGLKNIGFSATYMMLEVSNLLLAPVAKTTGSWFNPRRSTPRAFDYAFAPHVVLPKPTSAAPVPDNPAAVIGKTQQQREQNAAQAEYHLACLQLDARGPAELAQRFHDTVDSVVNLLRTSQDTARNAPDSALAYAERRLAKPLLLRLDELLSPELPVNEVQHSVRSLDLCQVDIPKFEALHAAPFERAVRSAAERLARLADAVNSAEISHCLATALSALTSADLGTVSADTLIGLFMLTLLRTSPEAASVFERQLFYLTQFACPPSGQISYAAMLAESVIHHLRSEHERLHRISQLNEELWHAVRDGDRARIVEIFVECPSALVSRKQGRSALFLALEDFNYDILDFLLIEFPGTFNARFVQHDRDMTDRTLLMAAVRSVSGTTAILRRAGDCKEYLRHVDLNGNNVGHYLAFVPDANTFAVILPLLRDGVEWHRRNLRGETPLMQLARHGRLETSVALMDNFYDHLDEDGNSLLHIAAAQKRLDCLVALVQNASTNINHLNARGQTALALVAGDSSLASALLRLGANAWMPMPPALCDAIMRSRVPYGPYIRRSLNVGYVVLYDPNNIDGCNTDEFSLADFFEFNRSLVDNFPHSWHPPLQETARAAPADLTSLRLPIESIAMLRLGDNSGAPVDANDTVTGRRNSISLYDGVGRLFADCINRDDNARLMFYLRIVGQHGTYAEAAKLFAGKKPVPSVSDIGHQSNESMQSMMAFFHMAMDQLRGISSGVEDVVRALACLTENNEEYRIRVQSKERAMGTCAAAVGLAFEIPEEPVLRPSLWRFLEMNLVLLAKAVSSFQKSLDQPTTLMAQLQGTERLLGEYRQRYDQMLQKKHSWLPSLEDKRAADIVAMERDISKLETQISNMQRNIAQMHFFLATELSAFNKTQETEVLHQIRTYAAFKLQSAKDRLRILQHGYRMGWT